MPIGWWIAIGIQAAVFAAMLVTQNKRREDDKK